MEKVIVVSSPGCPICMQVKMILKRNGISFDDCSISSEEGKKIVEESQMKSMPIVKIGGSYYCGSSALTKIRGDMIGF